MLIMICVLSITLLLKTSSDPVYVDDLAELVDDKTDIWDLEELENNNNVARWLKFRILWRILLRQSPDVKFKYRMKITERKRFHDEFIEERINRARDPRVKEFWNEVQKLDTDLTISESDAFEREFQMLSQLAPDQRKLIGRLCR
ncbi:hypothetical protein V3C99_018292 [Haemonchus contortus]|uniref:Uncharacterized protein n=1 Tax=Haemonchus contortus TaxID=6289 RepID=A0A7I5EE23_HAECO